MTATMPAHRHFSRRGLFRAGATALSLAALGAAAVHPLSAWAAGNSTPKRIILCSGWSFVNVGDISQTAGALTLLEKHFPAAQITLWLAHGDEAIEKALRARFPKIAIVKGMIDAKTYAVTGDDLKKSLDAADLFIHGSGPIGAMEALNYCREAKKHFGLLGVTFGNIDDKLASLLSSAKFVFTRETLSLAALKKAGVKGPAIGFCPDSALAFDLRDRERADTFLKSAGLSAGGFLCCVPRLRYAPFRHFPDAQIKQRALESEKFAEIDHAKMRTAMISWVKKTGQKVLCCAEMTYQLPLIDKLLIDPLPADVKASVVKRETFWMPDEAASVFARAAAVLSFELHSPVLAMTVGTPGLYLRQPTDTRKGQMLRDLDLPNWIDEIDETTGEQIAESLLAVHAGPAAAKARIAAAIESANKRFDEVFPTMEVPSV